MKFLKAILPLIFLSNSSFSSYAQVVHLGSAGFEPWKKDRFEEITTENGWLNLSGLFWLEENKTMLNEAGNNLSLESNPNEKNLGSFIMKSDSVWFIPNPETKSKFNLPSKVLQFPEEHYGDLALKVGQWKWSIIERGGLYGVRVRNLKHPAVEQFDGIPVYDYNPEWNFEAKFIPKFNESITITNVLGQEYDWNVMGHILFNFNGVDYELLALEEEGKLWVIFSDETNLADTYPTGRYMYVGFPDRTGKLALDFNYAYNPPCAFTSFATCPIPPKDNRLDFAIPAGEKMPKVLQIH